MANAQTHAVAHAHGASGIQPKLDLARIVLDERRKLAEDRRELLMLLAAGRVRLAPGDQAARRRALELLDQAEAIRSLGPSRALWLERAEDLERLGESTRAAEARSVAERTPATTARDHRLRLERLQAR